MQKILSAISEFIKNLFSNKQSNGNEKKENNSAKEDVENPKEQVPEIVEEVRKDLPTIKDAYFIKWNLDTTTVGTDKITERGLSYQAAVVVETKNLAGKKIKIKLLSGKRKVLSEVGSAIKCIDMADIYKETNVDKYKNIQPKTDFEVEVGVIEKDKAVVKLMLNEKADDLSFNLAKLIDADEDKAAFIYIEVSCDEPDVVYCGKADNKNTFLNGEGLYFQIKYLEQPWIVKAREEQEKGINEKTNAARVVEYHQVNRQYKPTSAATAWCASFVGWCLHKAGYSAQRDPGAYTYGNIKTLNRNNEYKFEDPIWAKKTNNNDIALGSICLVNETSHVTFSVALHKDKKIFFGLGGNQGDAVKISAYSKRTSSLYPKEYSIQDNDYELPVYYRPTSAEKTT